MQPAQKIISTVLALAKGGDLELASAVLNPAEFRDPAVRLAALVASFDYTLSEQFEQMVEGKSEAFATALKRKHSAASVIEEKRLEFYSALRDLLSSDVAFAYIPISKRSELEELRNVLQRI